MTLVDPGNLEVTLRKGFCLILNFKDFPGSGRNLDGLEKDVSALQNTFSEFGAKIRTRTDIKTSTIVRDKISALQLIDWTKYDYLVVVIMSHSEDGKFETSGGEQFKLSESQTGVNACPLIDGKPKFFFVNTCRSQQ
jgi:hypothetical protein